MPEANAPPPPSALTGHRRARPLPAGAVSLLRVATPGLILAALCMGAGGCASGPERTLTAAEFQANAESAYREALESFFDKDWINVGPLMEEVKREYAGTHWARLAQLRIADALFHQGSYPESITAYREFLRDFPSDPEVPYARYRVVLCHFEARGESALSPPLEERDLVSVMDADQAIAAFLKDYPSYPERTQLLYMQSWVRGMLARHELYVARYYLDRDHLEAALSRTQYALANYLSTGLEPEALVLLGETHMRRGDPALAREAFVTVISKYPNSPFAVPARNFLTKLSGVQ